VLLGCVAVLSMCSMPTFVLALSMLSEFNLMKSISIKILIIMIIAAIGTVGVQ